MGSIHNELRSSALQQAIRDAVGGSMDVEIERIGETLTPVLDIWRQPEWAQLRAERLWAIGEVPLAANVAGIGRFQLSNPAGSGVLVVVQQLSVLDVTAATNYRVTDNGAFIGAGLAPCSSRDTRYPIAVGGGSRPTIVQQAVDNAAAGPSGISIDFETGTFVTFPIAVPFVLTPGNWIQVQCGAVNHAQRFNAAGYERLAFPGEL